MTQEVRVRPDGNPCYVRKGEVVGGGFFIFRRGKIAGRIKPSQMPFEYGSLEDCLKGHKRLTQLYPESEFEVVVNLSAASLMVSQGVFDHSKGLKE